MDTIRLYKAEYESKGLYLRYSLRFYRWEDYENGHPNAIDGFLVEVGKDPIDYLINVLDATGSPYILYHQNHRLVFKGMDLYVRVCEEVVFPRFISTPDNDTIILHLESKMWLSKKEIFQNVIRHEEITKYIKVLSVINNK